MTPTVGAIVAIACLTGASCTSTQNATEVEFGFTFQSDAEGWIAGFADLPADFEPSIYELDSGHRPLPSGLAGNGLYIQGHNRSDDLFMFFKRRINGLRADATYAVFTSLDLATTFRPAPLALVALPARACS